jgi:hypothetical protein
MIAFTLSLTICWPQRTPSSSACAQKHSLSLSGWPLMPPSSAFTIFTPARITLVACGKLKLGGPPCPLM